MCSCSFDVSTILSNNSHNYNLINCSVYKCYNLSDFYLSNGLQERCAASGNENKLTACCCCSRTNMNASSNEHFRDDNHSNQECVVNNSKLHTNNNQNNNPPRHLVTSSTAYLTSRQDHLSSNTTNDSVVTCVSSSSSSSSSSSPSSSPPVDGSSDTPTLSRCNSLSTPIESPLSSPPYSKTLSMSSHLPSLHSSSSRSSLINSAAAATPVTSSPATSVTTGSSFPLIHSHSTSLHNQQQQQQQQQQQHHQHLQHQQQQQQHPQHQHASVGNHLTSVGALSPSVNGQQLNTSNDIMALHMHSMSQRSNVHMFNISHSPSNSLNSSSSTHHHSLANSPFYPSSHVNQLSSSTSNCHISPVLPSVSSNSAFINNSTDHCQQSTSSPSPSSSSSHILRSFSATCQSALSSASVSIDNESTRPYLQITEEPINRIRYRYKSEKGSHGGLAGERNCQSKRTFPTVRLENYHRNHKNILIKAYLVTNESTHKLHVHKLMGRNCTEDGICKNTLSENYTSIFQNLGILFVGKKEVPEILYQRKIEEYKLLYSLHGNSNSSNCSSVTNYILSDCEKKKLREEAEKEAKYMNLNCVRIAFEAYDCTLDVNYPIAGPIYSRAVANQKSPDSGELKIVRMDKYVGSVRGNEEIFLLCEKVNKKEIKIRFFQLDSHGQHSWHAFGSFTESDVHHQVAIVFRTPPFHSFGIIDPVDVYLQLYRERDGESSEPKIFTYYPDRSKKSRCHYSATSSVVSSPIVSHDMNEYHLTALDNHETSSNCVLGKLNQQNKVSKGVNEALECTFSSASSAPSPVSVTTNHHQMITSDMSTMIKRENDQVHSDNTDDGRSCNSIVNTLHQSHHHHQQQSAIDEHSNHSPLYIVSSTPSLITPATSLHCTTNSDTLFYSTC